MNEGINTDVEDDAPVPLTAAEVLLLAADTAYGEPSETTPEGQRKAQRLIEGILSAASARGFQHERTLRNLLEKNQPTRHVMELARAACNAVGHVALCEIFNHVGLSTHG
jgi:hypothetical protein